MACASWLRLRPALPQTMVPGSLTVLATDAVIFRNDNASITSRRGSWLNWGPSDACRPATAGSDGELIGIREAERDPFALPAEPCMSA
jgi:hypothetical protein